MSISLSLFYSGYLLAVLAFLVFSFFHIYVLIRFSAFSLFTIMAITLYCAVTIGILLLSWTYINQVDWQQTLNLIPTTTSL